MRLPWALMQALEQHRGRGRDDYPVRRVWNSLLAGIVFQHGSVEQTRRELSRNGQLRWLCGFDLARGPQAVPPAYVYTRFLRLLRAHTGQVEALRGTRRAMAYGGFEKDRQTLKYRCPAAHYGIECPGRKRCPVGQAVRIPLAEDRRVFTPLARSSYAWQRESRRRTAVERVNSRLDVSFGFEEHFLRGLGKMRLRVGLALLGMLAMAVGRIREKQKPLLRRLVAAA